MRWNEILNATAIPDTVDAYLDWATGIVCINRSIDEWHALRAGSFVRPDDQRLAEVLSHEAVHFIQLTTTGYGYRLSAELLRSVARCIRPDLSLEVPAEVPGQVAALMAPLDVPGPAGITVRALFESHAYHAQKRINWQGLTPEGFESLLEQAPAPAYRCAYDFAQRHLADAFDSFPLLCSLALFSADPPMAYVELVLEFRKRGLRYIPGNARQLLAFAHDFVGLSLGTAFDVHANLKLPHVVLVPVMQLMAKRHEDRGLDFIEGLARPHRQVEVIALDTMRPTLFNPVLRSDGGPQLPLWLPEALWSEIDAAARHTQAMVLLHLAAASASVLGAAPIDDLGHARAGTRSGSRAAWRCAPPTCPSK